MTHDSFLLSTFMSNYHTIVECNMQETTACYLKLNDKPVSAGKRLSWEQFRTYFFSHNEIYSDDLKEVQKALSLSQIRQSMQPGHGRMSVSFRAKNADQFTWYDLELLLPPQNETENTPLFLLGIRSVSPLRGSMQNTMKILNQRIHKVMESNLTTGTIRTLKQPLSESYLRQKYTRSHTINIEWLLEEGLIHSGDVAAFRRFTNPENIIHHFQTSSREYCFYYRRKIGNVYKWVRQVIAPTANYHSQNLEFLFIIEDIDEVLTNLLTTNGQLRYMVGSTSGSETAADMYSQNLMSILSYFTQKYIHFFMVDLKKDLYFYYKILPTTVMGNEPFSGSYSTMSRKYIANNFTGEQADRLLQYANPEALIHMLEGKTSVEFTFTHTDGRKVIHICTTIESENGKPTKVICCTLPKTDTRQLKIRTFGNFEVLDEQDRPIHFTRRQSKQLFAYLIDKQGLPVSPKDIAVDVLEKPADDLNAIKYISALTRSAIKDLDAAGYPNIIEKEWNSLRVNVSMLDCDYYHLMSGDASYFHRYHNEYMKEYSWAEETNSEILNFSSLI